MSKKEEQRPRPLQTLLWIYESSDYRTLSTEERLILADYFEIVNKPKKSDRK